jgi:TonB family protein
MLAAAPLGQPLRDSHKGSTRLAAFALASVALHALTLFTYGPGGAPRSGYADTHSPVIHASLVRSPEALNAPDASVATESRNESATDTAPPTSQTARIGSPGDIDIPVPEKWLMAHEVDTRAEPLTGVTIDYPAGIFAEGRVRVLLFIDERGVVRKSHVEAAVPAGVFDKAALDAWSSVRFSPATKAGIAVKSQKLVELHFTP